MANYSLQDVSKDWLVLEKRQREKKQKQKTLLPLQEEEKTSPDSRSMTVLLDVTYHLQRGIALLQKTHMTDAKQKLTARSECPIPNAYPQYQDKTVEARPGEPRASLSTHSRLTA